MSNSDKDEVSVNPADPCGIYEQGSARGFYVKSVSQDGVSYSEYEDKEPEVIQGFLYQPKMRPKPALEANVIEEIKNLQIEAKKDRVVRGDTVSTETKTEKWMSLSRQAKKKLRRKKAEERKRKLRELARIFQSTKRKFEHFPSNKKEEKEKTWRNRVDDSKDNVRHRTRRSKGIELELNSALASASKSLPGKKIQLGLSYKDVLISSDLHPVQVVVPKPKPEPESEPEPETDSALRMLPLTRSNSSRLISPETIFEQDQALAREGKVYDCERCEFIHSLFSGLDDDELDYPMTQFCSGCETEHICCPRDYDEEQGGSSRDIVEEGYFCDRCAFTPANSERAESLTG